MNTSQGAPGVSPELIEIRRESWCYACGKPGKVPPADSVSRPSLARLWKAGEAAVTKDPKARTFMHAGWRFAVTYAAGHLVVMDWHTNQLLVRPPASPERLRQIVDPRPEP